jgi:hypothetical protein
MEASSLTGMFGNFTDLPRVRSVTHRSVNASAWI